MFRWERRSYPRYLLPVPLTVEVRRKGGTMVAKRASAAENISAGGVYFSLAPGMDGFVPEGAKLRIIFPLVEPTFHPARVYAHCQARVVRRDGPGRVAAKFEQVAFVREERDTGLPVPLLE